MRKYLPPGGRGTAKRWMRNGGSCRNICASRGQTVFQYGAFLRTALVIGRFRHSSSVTKIGSEAPILATASSRGKPRALPRQYDKHQFIVWPSKANMHVDFFESFPLHLGKLMISLKGWLPARRYICALCSVAGQREKRSSTSPYLALGQSKMKGGK